MKTLIRKLVKTLRWPLKIIFLLFFNKKYLIGRHFDEGLIGYLWAISSIWQRNILRLAPPLPFPASRRIEISDPNNIDFHPDDLNNMQTFGVYFQNFNGKIIIGRGTYIAPNVGIITSNHDVKNLKKHMPGNNVVIGDSCWIGMNSVILPGVTIGNNTIIGAGSVVTSSHPEGGCIIAGNPAKVIRKLN